MKTSRKLLIAALLGAGLVVAGGAALAHKGGWHGGEGPRMERMLERMSEKLDLDEQQQATIRSLIEERRPLMQENRQAMRDSRRELFELVRGDTFDETALRALAADQGERMAEMIVDRGLMMRAIRDVLTPEQRAEAEQMLERRMDRRHGGKRWGDERD